MLRCPLRSQLGGWNGQLRKARDQLNWTFLRGSIDLFIKFSNFWRRLRHRRATAGCAGRGPLASFML